MQMFLFIYFYCCAGWGYIVAFTKVLTIYQIYHTWIHPLHHSPLSPPKMQSFKLDYFSYIMTKFKTLIMLILARMWRKKLSDSAIEYSNIERNLSYFVVLNVCKPNYLTIQCRHISRRTHIYDHREVLMDGYSFTFCSIQKVETTINSRIYKLMVGYFY
jgi:hypothetical protein